MWAAGMPLTMALIWLAFVTAPEDERVDLTTPVAVMVSAMCVICWPVFVTFCVIDAWKDNS